MLLVILWLKAEKFGNVSQMSSRANRAATDRRGSVHQLQPCKSASWLPAEPGRAGPGPADSGSVYQKEIILPKITFCLLWNISSILDRKSKDEWNRSLSVMIIIPGVPQGWALGPLPPFIYIKGLPYWRPAGFQVNAPETVLYHGLIRLTLNVALKLLFMLIFNDLDLKFNWRLQSQK